MDQAVPRWNLPASRSCGGRRRRPPLFSLSAAAARCVALLRARRKGAPKARECTTSPHRKMSHGDPSGHGRPTTCHRDHTRIRLLPAKTSSMRAGISPSPYNRPGPCERKLPRARQGGEAIFLLVHPSHAAEMSPCSNRPFLGTQRAAAYPPCRDVPGCAAEWQVRRPRGADNACSRHGVSAQARLPYRPTLSAGPRSLRPVQLSSAHSRRPSAFAIATG